MVKFTVAIDGPAAAGKGTIGQSIAKQFGFKHLDTGLLYRAVAKQVLDQGGSGDEETARQIAIALEPQNTTVNGLRSAEVGREASRVAAMASVREALLTFQREFALRDGGAVLDGRDIATVIAPNAAVKFFVTASKEVRAQRRLKELVRLGVQTTIEDVFEDLVARDERDMKRGLAALRKDENALLIDTSKLTIKEATSIAIAEVSKRLVTGQESLDR